MADVALFILQVVAEIRDVAKSMKETSLQANRLSDRVLAVEPPVRAVHEGTSLYSSESLHQLSETLTKIRSFLQEYAGASIGNRFRKRKSYANKFTQLGASLTEGMQALQLDVAVDTWANEDASDRLQDLNHLQDMMERIELKLTEEHAEVMDNQAKVEGALMENHAELMGNQAKLGGALMDNQAEILTVLKVSLESRKVLQFGDVQGTSPVLQSQHTFCPTLVRCTVASHRR